MTMRPLDFERLADALALTRTRLRRRALLNTLLWATSTLGVALLTLAALAAGLSGGRSFRVVAFGVVATLGAALVVRLLWRPWRAASDDAAVAAHLERGLPHLQDGLIASVQFSREWGVPGEQTPTLVTGLARQLAGQLSEVDLVGQTPMLPTRRPLVVAAAVLVAWGALAWAGPAWLTRGLGTLLPARTEDGARLVGPLVGDLELTLVYPEYMKRADRVIPNSTGDFEAPRGTQVQVRATTLEPARALSLRFAAAGAEGAGGGPTEIALALSDARDALGRYTVTQAGKYRFVVVTDDGETQAEALERHLRLEPDQPPSVTLKLPAGDGEIDDLRPIRVEFEGGDDHGVSKAAILLTLEADADHPERIEQPGISGKRVTGGDEIDLTRIQAAGGDKIGISVEIWDNCTADAPQRSVSAIRWLTIHSPQKKHQDLMERLNALVDLFVTALADRLEIDFRASELGPPLLAPLHERVNTYFAETEAPTKTLAEIVVAMKDDPLTPKEVNLALAGRLGELERALSTEKTTIAANVPGLGQRTDASIRAVSRANEVSVDKVEQTIVLIEALVARLALEELMALTDEIKASTGRLRDLIKEYKQAPTDALKQRIRRDIQRLKNRIQEIRERIAKLKQKLPEEFLNMDGLKDDKVSEGLEQAQSQLDQLEKLLDENKLDEAMAALEAMEKSLEELDSQLNEDMNDLNQETNPEMQKAISELMDQTRDLITEQQALNDATDEALKEYEDCLQKILKEDLKTSYESLMERGARLRGHIERVDPVDLPPYMTNDLEEARQRVDQFGAALVRPELVDAVEMAERLVDSMETMERSVRLAGIQPSETSREALSQGKALARELSRDAANLLRQFEIIKRRECDDKQRQVAMPQPQPGLGGPPQPPPGEGEPQPGEGPPTPGDGPPTPGDGKAPGQRQRQVAQGARRLQQRIGEQGEVIPGLPPEMGQKAGNAAQAMDQAGEKLEQQRPSDARPSQRQAMNELQGIMEGLKQSAAPQRAQRGQQEGEGRENSRKKVEIPGADDHESPAEFRKDLLDAMKDKAPDEFQEQVKRYYESLVE